VLNYHDYYMYVYILVSRYFELDCDGIGLPLLITIKLCHFTIAYLYQTLDLTCIRDLKYRQFGIIDILSNSIMQ
jgi:hypothetical protein